MPGPFLVYTKELGYVLFWKKLRGIMELVDTATEAITVVAKKVIDNDTFEIPNENNDVEVDTKNLDGDAEEILI